VILERMKSEDDKKSQTGKSVNGEAMKQKLLSGIYTSEEVEGILNNMGLGYNADQASKKAKSLTENVKSVEFQDPRRLTTGNKRLNDSQVGRIFFETLGSTIIQGGEPLVAVVKTNFPVSLFLDEVKSKMQDLEESILICESALVEVEEPNQRIMDMRHELDISEKEELLLLKCKGKFMSRTGGLSRGVTTRSQATAKVGSDDGIADVEVEVIEIRKDGVQRVLEHAYRLENDASLREVVGEYSNMPLYSELVRWINDIHLKSIQFSSPSVQNTNAPIRTLKSQPAYEKPRDLEQAAAATVSRPYETGKTSKTLASGVYENEITRDQKLFCSNGFLYVATIAPCSNCAHAPRCFQRQCPKCKFWGHREQECHQRPRSDQAGVAGKTS